MSVLVLPAMTKAQRAGWSTLMTLADRIPTGWCLVGGQMVHLHCWERGASPSRPTDDGDIVPAALTNSDLERLGFALGALKQSSGLSARVAGGPEGIQRLTLIYEESHRLRGDRRK